MKVGFSKYGSRFYYRFADIIFFNIVRSKKTNNTVDHIWESQKHSETNPTVYVSVKHIVGGENVHPRYKFPGATIFI